jgi:radical SAM protein with 4Fe4S-binding SPASM domain
MATVDKLIKEISKSAAVSRTPVIGQFELISRCNLSCSMCYVMKALDDKAAESQELSAQQWIEVFYQARDAGLLIANLTGGEPVLKNDFWEIYDALSEMGVLVTLNTNGTTMSERTVARLRERPPLMILVSLYGVSPETYAKVCGNGGAYKLALEGTSRLIEAGLPLKLRTTPIRDNRDDVMPLIDWANERGLPLETAGYVFPRGTAGESQAREVRFEANEHVSFFQDVTAHWAKSRLAYAKEHPEETPMIPGTDGQTENEMLAAEWESHLENFQRGAFSCAAGTISYYVTAEGRMCPCGMLSDIGFPLNGTNFSEVWRELNDWLEALPSGGECDDCSDSKQCSVCPARRYRETGSFTAKPDYICDITKAQIIAAIAAARQRASGVTLESPD